MYMKRLCSGSLLAFCLVLLALGGFAARPALATVAILTSDAELTQSSRVILEGEILSAASHWEGAVIYTYIEVSVGRVLKGRLKGSTVVVKQLGGTVGEIAVMLYGSPTFRKGERVLLFLDTWPDGALRVAHLFMGKYDVVRDTRTGRSRAVRKVDEGVELLAKRTPGEITHSADLATFRGRIGRLVREQGTEEPAAAPDIVEIPQEVQPSRSASGSGLRVIADPFILLVTNNLYHRWFQPDSGQAVGFWFNLTQAPTANAHQSLINAEQAWTNVPTAKIVLDFSGYTTAGGFSADYLNTISFEDPLGQIQDPVNEAGRCSGIIAIAPLVRSNDSNFREVNKTSFYQILETDVVYNNGWTLPCSLFVNDASTKVVEEVATHELGHTIGLGHSQLVTRAPGDAPSMRSFFYNNGRGSRLGFDDEVGVTFIYPEPGNPIDHPRYFMGWHYRDWLERETDAPGLNFWTSQITSPDLRDDRALAFPFSPEFFEQIDTRFHPSNRGTAAYNDAFVQECYERYWKRAKDSNYWVDWLNARIPNSDWEDYRTVIRAFIEDFEYRSRFDPYLCDPDEEQACYASGGTWDPWSCSCSYPPPCDPWWICQ
jgi:dual-action HEIGH metallo-peptidase